MLKTQKYPMLFIHDVLQHITGYFFLTKLNISMQCFGFELNEEFQQLCVIITPILVNKYTNAHPQA